MKKAIKHDSSKPDLTLVPPELIEQVAVVMGFGAKKYGRNNWKDGMEQSRYLAAAMRHINSLLKGEEFDSESGLSHIAHAATNLAFLLHYRENNLGTDNLGLTPK